MITSRSVAVPRVLERRRRDPDLDGAGEVHGRVVDQDVDPDLHAAGDLVVGAVQLVVRAARSASSHSLVCACASTARWLVMWMKWPCSCQRWIVSTAPGYGSAARTCSARWVSSTQAWSCSGSSRSIAHVNWRVVGQVDAEAALGDLGELVPVGMQRRVDVDREAHGRWYGSGVSGFLGQVRALPANAFVRSQPDPTYARRRRLDLDDGRLAVADARGADPRPARQRGGQPAAPGRRCCSCTASAGCGRTGC